MANDADAVLFWLEQELVDSDADIYLPADTPMTRPSPKVLYQMNKKQELKKQRAIERLRAYHFEQLTDRRKKFCSLVKREQLPKQHFGVIEPVASSEHLKEILPDLLSILNDIEKLKKGEITAEALNTPAQPDLDMETRLLVGEKVRENYAERVEEQTFFHYRDLRQQYTSRLNLIKPQPPPSPQPPTPTQLVHTEASPVILRPPSRDPRERPAE